MEGPWRGGGIGFDARILLYDIYPDEKFAESIGAEFVGLDTLVQSSDFVSIHVPLSDATEGLIGARELSMMKPSAYLINTARGWHCGRGCPGEGIE